MDNKSWDVNRFLSMCISPAGALPRTAHASAVLSGAVCREFLATKLMEAAETKKMKNLAFPQGDAEKPDCRVAGGVFPCFLTGHLYPRTEKQLEFFLPFG